MHKNNLFKKIFLLLLLIIPINILAYSNKIIPGGNTIGIEVNSNGVMVVGFYEVDNKLIGKDIGFKLGDIITHINKNKLESISNMVDIINSRSNDTLNFKIIRNNKPKEIIMKIEKDSNIIKTGLYVKDKITGIGTLSYIDPETKVFGSLGHPIIETKTAEKFEIKDGKIYEANVSNIIKSKRGVAGEKNATYNKTNTYGEIKQNKDTGIYGIYKDSIDKEKSIYIVPKDKVTTGKAVIRTVVENNKVENFNINILKIFPNNKTKNILYEVTDERLLEKAGGIIQGMSGSPILQEGKIIGAVNYVILNDPSKGYGIFIETMLEEGEK